MVLHRPRRHSNLLNADIGITLLIAKSAATSRVTGERVMSQTEGKDYVYSDPVSGLEWIIVNGPKEINRAERHKEYVVWKDAEKAISTLTTFGGGWRMPTMLELRELYYNSHRSGIDNVTKQNIKKQHIKQTQLTIVIKTQLTSTPI